MAVGQGGEKEAESPGGVYYVLREQDPLGSPVLDKTKYLVVL